MSNVNNIIYSASLSSNDDWSCLNIYYPPMPQHASIFRMASFHTIHYMINETLMFHVTTEHWCKVCGFDDETTVHWLLRYGDTLPLYVSDLCQYGLT